MTSERFLWPEAPDAREAVRLELVSLAAEVVTLSQRIGETLRGLSGPQAHALHDQRMSLAERASSVLHPQNRFEDITIEALRSAAVVVRDDQRAMSKVREDAEAFALAARRRG